MKIILITLLLINLIVISGCSNAGLDPKNCLESVRHEFPNSKVYGILGFSKYKFIVIDTNKMMYLVETMNITNTDITGIYFLKESKN